MSCSPGSGRTPFVSVLSVLVSSLTLWTCPTVHCLSCLSLTVSLSPSLSTSQDSCLPQPSCIAVGALGLRVQGSGPGRWNQGLPCSEHLSRPSALPVCHPSVTSWIGSKFSPKKLLYFAGSLASPQAWGWGKWVSSGEVEHPRGRPDALHPQGLPVELLRGAAAAGADLDVCRACCHRPPLRPLPDPLCCL